MKTLQKMLKIALFSLLSAAVVQMAMAGDAGTPSPKESFFPLAVGNTWTYKCSMEGESLSSKTTTIVSTATQNGHTVYRSEMRVGKDPKPLVSYLHLDSEGRVMRSLESDLSDAKPIMAVTPKVGDRFDDLDGLTVTAIEPSDIEKFSKIKAARLENYPYPMDGPEDKQLRWLAKWYGKGIGPLAESNGVGGECVLTSFRAKKAKK